METIKERVLKIAEKKGISKELFANEIGMTYGNFKGKAKETPLNSNAIANILSIYPDINPEWLLTGIGSMLKSEIKPTKKADLQECLDEKERLQSDVDMLKQSLKVNHKYITGLEKENKELKSALEKKQDATKYVTKNVGKP